MSTKVPDAKGQLLCLNSVGKWAIVLCSPSGRTQPMVSAAYFGSSAFMDSCSGISKGRSETCGIKVCYKKYGCMFEEKLTVQKKKVVLKHKESPNI